MTETDRAQYALAQRIACRPMECSLAPMCWVASGAADALQHGTKGTGGAPRCLACGGKLLLEQWRTPAELALPPHGRLNSRGHSRGPAGRRGEMRPGDSGRTPLGRDSSPASGAS